MPNDTSLRDDLSAGFEGASSDSSADVNAGSDATALTGGADPSASGVGGDLTPLEAPAHWQEADRTLFGKWPRDVQQWTIDRDKRYSQGFNKVSEQIAQFKRDRQSWDDVFRDRDRDLGLNGLNRHQFVQQLVQWNDYLSKDPAGAMRAIAQRMGVDLKTLLDAPALDPQLTGLSNEVKTLKQQLTSQEQTRQREAYRTHLDSVEAFASAKGQDGKLLHPYFDEISGELMTAIRAERAAGRKPDLEKCYAQACRMNERVWEKLQAEQVAAKTKQQENDRKTRVDAARRAAVGTSGEGNGTTQPKSLREDLEAGFAAWPG